MRDRDQFDQSICWRCACWPAMRGFGLLMQALACITSASSIEGLSGRLRAGANFGPIGYDDRQKICASFAHRDAWRQMTFHVWRHAPQS